MPLSYTFVTLTINKRAHVYSTKIPSTNSQPHLISMMLQEGVGTGFSWSNMLGMLMQMLLGQTAGIASPSKNEIDEGVPASPWANLLSVGLRVLTAILGGPQQQVDGIDKVDNQSSSPMQVQTLLWFLLFFFFYSFLLLWLFFSFCGLILSLSAELGFRCVYHLMWLSV